MNDQNLEVFANRNFMRRRIDLYVTATDRTTGARSVGMEIVLAPNDEGATVPPTVSLPLEAAQQLMDELWLAGIRPADGTGNIGQTGAMANHLNDMRAIAFNALKLQVTEIKK